MPVDPELQAVLDFLAAADTPAMSSGTPEQARRAFRTLAVDLRDPTSAPDVASIEQITVPGGAGPLPARVYRPHTGGGALPTVVFFHGGGFVIGDLDTHDPLARLLAVRCDAVVVSVDYRLAPEHPFPAAVEDAVAATRWAAEHLDELGGSHRLAVAGDSAGGNLSAVVTQAVRDEVALVAQLLLYPSTDFLSDLPSRTDHSEGYFLSLDEMEWFGTQYAGDLTVDPDRLLDPRLSPLHGELGGLPPAVVVVAEFDPLRDEGAAYAQAMEEADVPVVLLRFDGLIHGFLDMLQYSAAARVAGDETCRQFRELLHD